MKMSSALDNHGALTLAIGLPYTTAERVDELVQVRQHLLAAGFGSRFVPFVDCCSYAPLVIEPLPAVFALPPEPPAVTTARSLFLRPGLVDGQAATLELLLVERRARSAAFVRVGHLDEPKAARPSGRVVADEADRLHLAEWREQRLEFLVFRVEGQITDVDFHRTILEEGWSGGLSILERATTKTQAEQTRAGPT
jgi:hypothetical protein